MATTLILILLLIAGILLTFHHVRASAFMLIFTLFCFVIIGNGVVPSILLERLQSSYANLPPPTWQKNNAIVLLGAGAVQVPVVENVQPSIMAYSRINKAAALYQSCLNSHNHCIILITGGDALKTGRSEAEVYKEILLTLGIDAKNIVLEPNSMNTFKNAEYTSAILKKEKVDQVILVTSGIHLQRALLYFSYFGVQAKPALADYLVARSSLLPLGYNFAMADFAAHEYIGIARFHVYNWLGLNKEVSSAGTP